MSRKGYHVNLWRIKGNTTVGSAYRYVTTDKGFDKALEIAFDQVKMKAKSSSVWFESVVSRHGTDKSVGYEGYLTRDDKVVFERTEPQTIKYKAVINRRGKRIVIKGKAHTANQFAVMAISISDNDVAKVYPNTTLDYAGSKFYYTLNKGLKEKAL